VNVNVNEKNEVGRLKRGENERGLGKRGSNKTMLLRRILTKNVPSSRVPFFVPLIKLIRDKAYSKIPHVNNRKRVLSWIR